tara:strand:- start:974 stop:1951 length:978 start_codon:yes stop_codon:yes gene_type:complete
VNKYIKLIIGTVFSIIGLYFAFKGENLGQLVYQIQQVNMDGVLLACALLLASCIVRAYRWQLILNPIQSINLKPVFAATMIGYFGNGVLAFRLGELLRAYSVAANRKLTVSQAFGTVILERILDLLMVLIIFILTIPWFPFDHKWIRLGIFVFASITIISIVLVYVVYRFQCIDKIGEFSISNTKLGKTVFSLLNKVFDGITIIVKTNHTGLIIFLSFVLWAFYFLVTLIILDSCGLNIGYIGTGILLILGSVAIGIPALPGSAGTYDAGIKYSLMLVFGIGGQQALRYAIVSHAVSYFPLVIVGAVYFLLGSVRMKDINMEQTT